MKLVSNSGNIQSLFVKVLLRKAKEEKVNLDIQSISISHIDDVLENTDLFIFAPEYGYKVEDYKERMRGYSKYVQLENKDYSLLHTKEILKISLDEFYRYTR